MRDSLEICRNMRKIVEHLAISGAKLLYAVATFSSVLQFIYPVVCEES